VLALARSVEMATDACALVHASYNDVMRASMLVPCALVFAGLAGCKAPGRSSPARSEGSAAEPPAATSSAGEPIPEAAEALPSIFVPDPDRGVAMVLDKNAPNMRYAKLDRDSCLAELGRRAIAFEEAPATEWARRSRTPIARLDKAPPTPKQTRGKQKLPGRTKQAIRSKRALAPKAVKDAGPPPTDGIADASHVLAPVRLRGPLHGIEIHSGLPEKQRAKSTIEIFDCRLILALDDFASVLAKHDIVEVVHMSAFRSQRDRGCTPKYAGKQHCGALAVDVGTMKRKDGSVLDVDKDFNGRIGTETCTAGTGPVPVTPAATELWDIVCDSARRGLFHVILTPNFNAEHKNHFHLEITPDVSWMLVK